MKEIARLSATLTLIAALSGLSVGLTYQTTRAAIEAQLDHAHAAALAAVVPAGTTVVTRHGAGALPPTYWAALRDSVEVAYAFNVSSHGYSSDIDIIAGVDTSGMILGVRILGQNETPGLGSRVAEVVSSRYLWSGFCRGASDTPWFTKQFEGLTLDKRITVEKSAEWHGLGPEQRAQLAAANAVTAIGGATVSTLAVVRGLELQVYGYLRAIRGGAR